jgi:hypothetical protein
MRQFEPRIDTNEPEFAKIFSQGTPSICAYGSAAYKFLMKIFSAFFTIFAIIRP